MTYSYNNETKVVVSGFGEVDYPNIPTFQEVTTLQNSLLLIEEHLRTQNKYSKSTYLFSVNILDNAEYVYSFMNGEISVSEKFKNLKFGN